MIKLEIKGMSCGHCKAAVAKALQAVDGVERVEVDLEAGEACVEGAASTDALVAAVKDEGYEVRVG